MLKCSACGALNDEGSAFCEECGSKIAPPAPAAEQPVQPYYPPMGNSSVNDDVPPSNPVVNPVDDPNKNKSSLLIYIISGIVIFFALFTIFNVLVCEDIINGTPGSGLENYEYSILNAVAPEKIPGMQPSIYGYTTTNGNNQGQVPQTATPTSSTQWVPSTTTTTTTTTKVVHTVTNPAPTAPVRTTEYYYDAQVTGTGRAGLILRASPSTSARQLNNLPEGTKFNIIDVVDNVSDGRRWFQVRYKGSTGWVAGEYVTLFYYD